MNIKYRTKHRSAIAVVIEAFIVYYKEHLSVDK